MRRMLTMCMVAALIALPLMAWAQARSQEGYLIPKDAEPNQPSMGTAPSQPSARSQPSIDPAQDRKLVRQAQMALRQAGYDPGGTDGMMGPKTQQALRQFQAAQGLPQTGQLDTPTQRQLFAAHTPESSGRR